MVKENYIEWYKDNKIMITFSEVPNVRMRIITPCMPLEDIEDIDNYPFICLNTVKVNIFVYAEKEIYSFEIPKNFKYDGASIPRAFWRLIGSPTNPEFLIPSLVHDVLCSNHSYINNDRYLSTMILERLLYVSKVPAFKRWMMKHSVDNYQKFCGWND